MSRVAEGPKWASQIAVCNRALACAQVQSTTRIRILADPMAPLSLIPGPVLATTGNLATGAALKIIHSFMLDSILRYVLGAPSHCMRKARRLHPRTTVSPLAAGTSTSGRRAQSSGPGARRPCAAL